MFKQNRFPDGWMGGKVIQPTFTYSKAVEKGTHKYKILTNGQFGLKIKDENGNRTFYVWSSLSDYYSDAKTNAPVSGCHVCGSTKK